MAGSGLKELLEVIYASNAVDHMLTGKAISSAWPWSRHLNYSSKNVDSWTLKRIIQIIIIWKRLKQQIEPKQLSCSSLVSAELQFKEIAIFVSTKIRITYLIIHVYVYIQDMAAVD